MADGPRHNDRLLKMVEKTYEMCLFSGDDGMWTIFEVVKRPIAQAPSEAMAGNLMNRLAKGDRHE